mmetsp:Transcript_20703/g.43231  ORF Transcript_20703/g.43231 Transcript_20703/m.43231 type:complete len:277 (+) Transcript_20703:732-1562(+)
MRPSQNKTQTAKKNERLPPEEIADVLVRLVPSKLGRRERKGPIRTREPQTNVGPYERLRRARTVRGTGGEIETRIANPAAAESRSSRPRAGEVEIFTGIRRGSVPSPRLRCHMRRRRWTRETIHSDNDHNQPPPPPSPPLRQLRMHRRILQNRPLVHPPSHHLPPFHHRRKRQAIRHPRRLPQRPDRDHTGVGIVGVLRGDDDDQPVRGAALVGPGVGGRGGGVRGVADDHVDEGEGQVGRDGEEVERCFLEHVRFGCCRGDDSMLEWFGGLIWGV